MEDLKLSVSIITYNQIGFIAQTVESVLRQKVNFKYEIIIGDDFSTDGTREILLKYQKQHPDLIKLILHPQKNEGVPGKVNFVSTINAARGRYVALLDGDDYWFDDYKLQKQVDFLEANSDFAICFHKVQIVYENSSQESQSSNIDTPQIIEFEDLALRNHIYALSCVFRNRGTKFPDWYKDMAAGDYPLHLLNAQYGKIRYFDEVMAVYRVHASGVWSTKSDIERYLKWVNVVETCRKHFGPRGAAAFSQQLAHYYKELCLSYFNANEYADFRKYYIKYLKSIGFVNIRAFFALTIRYILSYAPSAAMRYNTLRKVKRNTNY